MIKRTYFIYAEAYSKDGNFLNASGVYTLESEGDEVKQDYQYVIDKLLSDNHIEDYLAFTVKQFNRV